MLLATANRSRVSIRVT